MPNNDRRRKNWNYQIENSHDYWFVVMMNGVTLFTVDSKGERTDDYSYKDDAYLKYEADYKNDTRTEGNLIWYKSDGSEEARYKATSGSGKPKKYTLPARKYVASNYRTSTDPKFMRNGIGFKVTLGPSSVWDAKKGDFRTSLLIHPARSNGTEGCIGLISNDSTNISDFQTRIDSYLQIHQSINLTVEY